MSSNSNLGACLKTPAPHRVRPRGLQETAEIAMGCRPGALTGRVFKPALGARGIVFASVCFTLTHAMSAEPFTPNYDESKVPQYTLPDPLVMGNGRKVADAKTWQTKRRT